MGTGIVEGAAPCGIEGGGLHLCRAFAAGDDGAGMTCATGPFVGPVDGSGADAPVIDIDGTCKGDSDPSLNALDV